MADGQPLRKPPGFADQNPTARPPQQPMGPRRAAVPPSFYKPKKKKRNCCRFCCCCICLIIVILIILLAIAVGLFYLWFTPKLPIFRIRPVEFDRFNITTKSDGTALLDTQVVLRVEAKNPNGKMLIFYGDTGVTLTADDETELGTANMPAFKQPTNNVTIMKFTMKTNKQMIDKTTAKALQKRLKSQEVVIDAAVKTKVGLGVGSWKLGMLAVHVKCGGVSLKRLNEGSTPPKCSFHALRWININ